MDNNKNTSEKEIVINELDFETEGIQIITDGTECYKITVMPDLISSSE